MKTLRAIVACLMAFTIVFSAVSIISRTELFSGVKSTVTEGVNNVTETFGDMDNATLENLIKNVSKGDEAKVEALGVGSTSMSNDNLTELLIEQLTESKTDDVSLDSETLLENLDDDGSFKVPFDEIYPEAISEGIVEFDDASLLIKKSKDNEGISFDMIWAGVAKLEVLFELENDIWYTAKLIKGVDVTKTVEKLRQLEEIKSVDYDYKMQTTAMAQASEIPEEMAGNEKINDQWHMQYCGIPEGYEALGDDKKGGSSDVIVAVIDTGVDYDHEDLKNNIWVNKKEIPDNDIDDDQNGYVDDYYGVNVVSGKGNGDDDNGHGTHVAGIIASENNEVGTVGLAYNTKIMPIKAANSSGNFLQSDIAKAIIYAYENGAEVINMSFGGTACSEAVQEALKAAHKRCVLVASAGNDGKANEGDKEDIVLPNYPAALDYVLGVMSVGKQGIESLFTNYDALKNSIIGYDIYAPGESIVSTIPNNKYASWSGTSMASPMVAAMAALLRAHFADRDKYTPEYIYGQLVSSTDDKANCCNPEEHGEHFVPDIANLGNALTKESKPEIIVTDYSLFDTVGLEQDTDAVNNGDSAVDVGETLALGLELKNQWGAAKDVTVTVDCNSVAGIPDPYIEILTSTANYGGLGTYSKTDAGKVYTDNLFTSWEKPVYLKIAKECPNNYVFNVNVTITSKNDINTGDETVYETKDTLSFTVRNGVVLDYYIDQDMVLTKDNLYIIPNGVYIEEGVTVTVEPGTNIQFWSSDPEYVYSPESGGANLVVGGTFKALGTKEEPIKMYPSDLMSDKNVSITGEGNIDLTYVEITNPVVSAETLDGCVIKHNANIPPKDGNSVNASVIKNCEFNDGHVFAVYAGEVIDTAFCNMGALYLNAPVVKGNAFIDSSFDMYNVSCLDQINDNLFIGNCAWNDRWDAVYGSSIAFDAQKKPVVELIPAGVFDTYIVTETVEKENAFGQVTTEEEETMYFTEKGVFAYEKKQQDVMMPFVNYILKPDVIGGSLKIETEDDLKYYSTGEISQYGIEYESALYNLPIDFELLFDENLKKYTWADGTELASFLEVEGITDTKSEYSPIFYNGQFVDGETFANETMYCAVELNTLCLPNEHTLRNQYGLLASMLDFHEYYEMVQIKELYNQFFTENPVSFFKNNAIINPISTETDTLKWLRLSAPQIGVKNTYKLAANYWGTTNESAIELQVVDGKDNIDYARMDVSGYLTEAPETTYPFVTDVTVLNKEGEKVTSVGNEEITVRVEFNRDINTSIPLNVAFGNLNEEATFKNVYKLTGDYVDERTWEGTYSITSFIESGYHYFVIDNACANGTGYKLYDDVGRFSLRIDTTSAQSMTMQAEATNTGIKLTWEQDDFDTLVGYNVYRSTSEDGFYQRINNVMIPADELEFFDDGVEPGQTYYYNFTVVKSDLNESEPSGKVIIQAKDTMAPDIYHSNPGTAFMGENLVLSATVTDNLAVQNVKLYYRTTGETEWNVSVMNKLNDKYSSIIQSSEISKVGLEYYIEAFDGVSYTYRGSQENPYTIAVKDAVTNNSLGDVNGDGVITNLDALMLLKHINDQINLDAEQFARADLNGDNELTPEEALRILHYVSGASSSLTA